MTLRPFPGHRKGSDSSAVHVEHDVKKGRILMASKDFVKGEVAACQWKKMLLLLHFEF